MVVAIIAVFFALGGTAIAARHYLITSTSQIKPSVIAELRGKVVTSGPEGAQGPQGVPGPQGAQGTAGPQGIAGPPGAPGQQGEPGPRGEAGPAGTVETSALTEVFGEEATLPKRGEKGTFSEVEGVEGSFAECPVGSRVLTGGADIFAGRAGAITGQLSVPSEDRSAWIVIAANGGEEKGIVEAIGFCAHDNRAVLASSHERRARRARNVAELRRLLVKMDRRWHTRTARR